MKFRAVIFDIYKTVLEVGPPPVDREGKWQQLAHDRLGIAPPLSFAQFTADCEGVIAREHALARKAGILHPEIFWPDVVTEIMPGLKRLPAVERDDFLFQQQSLFHDVRLMRGAADVLRFLRERGVLMGIASNAQPYTRREVDRALADEKLSLAVFTPELCFWSFAHGFSKPDPHVFRLLTARARAHGVQAVEMLMVGDRLDNDIEPARAQGWNTWRLQASSRGETEGDWGELREFLTANITG